MKPLDRKLWRELWQLKGQAVAIMLVMMSLALYNDLARFVGAH